MGVRDCRPRITRATPRRNRDEGGAALGRVQPAWQLQRPIAPRFRDGYSLDFVVEWAGERLGVELGGPSHFIGREPNGATLLNRRQLRHLGWRLAAVPYWEWNELSRSDKGEERTRHAEYLRSLLDSAVPAS